jgi:uncharacterized glyoxalase superfamily protein PhnB
VKKVNDAIDFYCDKLDFTIAFRDPTDPNGYAGVKRDSIEIHLQWHDEKEWEESIDRPMLRIYVDNIEELFEEYNGKGVFHKSTSLKKMPWGTKEFAFYDLFGNGLTFYRDL